MDDIYHTILTGVSLSIFDLGIRLISTNISSARLIASMYVRSVFAYVVHHPSPLLLGYRGIRLFIYTKNHKMKRANLNQATPLVEQKTALQQRGQPKYLYN